MVADSDSFEICDFIIGGEINKLYDTPIHILIQCKDYNVIMLLPLDSSSYEKYAAYTFAELRMINYSRIEGNNPLN